jgi:hypothetical protein
MAAAQDVPQERAQELSRGLNTQTTRLAGDRYMLAAGPLTGATAQGETARINVRLWAGQDYVLAAVCDSRCADLNLRLIDPRGAVLSADDNANAAPVLHARPEVTGQHTIEARMPRCRERCWFAVNVYAR